MVKIKPKRSYIDFIQRLEFVNISEHRCFHSTVLPYILNCHRVFANYLNSCDVSDFFFFNQFHSSVQKASRRRRCNLVNKIKRCTLYSIS